MCFISRAAQSWWLSLLTHKTYWIYDVRLNKKAPSGIGLYSNKVFAWDSSCWADLMIRVVLKTEFVFL